MWKTSKRAVWFPLMQRYTGGVSVRDELKNDVKCGEERQTCIDFMMERVHCRMDGSTGTLNDVYYEWYKRSLLCDDAFSLSALIFIYMWPVCMFYSSSLLLKGIKISDTGEWLPVDWVTDSSEVWVWCDRWWCHWPDRNKVPLVNSQGWFF